MSRTRTASVPALAAALGAALLGGCATARPAPVVWPAPPVTERIRWVRTLSGGTDVESGWARFWRKLAALDAPPRMYHPLGVAVSSKGDVVAVSDQGLSQLLIFDLATGAMHTIPKEDLVEPPGGVAMEGDKVWLVVPKRKVALSYARDGRPLRALELPDCERPFGIAVDAERGVLWVSDASSPDGEGHSLHVHDLATGAHVRTVAKKGNGEGQLFFPTFLTLAPGGGVYVADTMNARVVEFSKDGAFVRQLGERGDRLGQFDKPKGVALDAFGNVYVVDGFFAAVQIFNREGKLLLFFGGPGDGPGMLANPAGIAIDGNNRIYVANGLNYRVDVYDLVNTTSQDSGLTESASAQR
jgi:DNA-binding beta-propeller fold protein YncE